MGGGGGGTTTSTTATTTTNTNVTGGSQTAIGGGSNIEINAAKGITTGGVYFQGLPFNESSGSAGVINAGSEPGPAIASVAVPSPASPASSPISLSAVVDNNWFWIVAGGAIVSAVVAGWLISRSRK